MKYFEYGKENRALGHGGVAGEQPERFLKEMMNTHEALQED